MIQVKSLESFAHPQLLQKFSFVPEILLHPSAFLFQVTLVFMLQEDSCRYVEIAQICQKSIKFSFQRPYSLEKQSRVFTQISPAHSDDLRATQTSSQNLTVGYQTLQSNRSPLYGHILVPHRTTAQRSSTAWKMKGISIQARKTDDSFVYLLPLTGLSTKGKSQAQGFGAA